MSIAWNADMLIPFSLWLWSGVLGVTAAVPVESGAALAQRIELVEKQDRLRHRTLRIDQLSSVQLQPFRLQNVAPLSAHGSLLLVHLWSVHCPPCVKEMPELQRMLARLAAENRMRVAFVSQDSADELREYFQNWQAQLPVASKYEFYLAATESQLQASLQSVPLPLTLLVDAHMVVREAFVGPLLGRGNDLFSMVRRLCRSAGTDCQPIP